MRSPKPNQSLSFDLEDYAEKNEPRCVNGLRLAFDMVSKAITLVNFYTRSNANETRAVMGHMVVEAASGIGIESEDPVFVNYELPLTFEGGNGSPAEVAAMLEAHYAELRPTVVEALRQAGEMGFSIAGKSDPKTRNDGHDPS